MSNSTFFQVDDAEFQAWAKRVESKASDEVLKAQLQKSMKRVGVMAMKTVKARTPVDTGHLRRVWHLENAGVLAIELYNNAEYAPYVENGHRTRGGGWVPGQFFLRDSLVEMEALMPGLLTTGLLKALEGMLD